MKKYLGVLIVMFPVFFYVALGYAQPPGLDFVFTGSGARAMAMGGAFTSIADDATAAWWNPAGLSQLDRPEVSIVGQYRTMDASQTSTTSNVKLTGKDETISLNFASFVYPLGGTAEGARKSISLSYGAVLDLNSDTRDTLGNFSTMSGGLYAANLAAATELSPNLSIGASFSMYTGKLKDEELVNGNSYYSDKDFSGYSGSVGLLLRQKSFNIGMMYRTAFLLEVKGIEVNNNVPVQNKDIKFPHSWGIGFAYKPSEHFTAAIDLQHVNMSRFSGEEGNYEDIYQPRIGLEYLIITKGDNVIPIRVGWFTNNQPGLDENGQTVKGMGYSVGTGIVFTDFQLDIAYVFMERDPVIQTNRTLEKQDVQRVLLSAIYRF